MLVVSVCCARQLTECINLVMMFIVHTDKRPCCMIVLRIALCDVMVVVGSTDIIAIVEQSFEDVMSLTVAGAVSMPLQVE